MEYQIYASRSSVITPSPFQSTKRPNYIARPHPPARPPCDTSAPPRAYLSNMPFRYALPKLYCAFACSCSAALRYQRTASRLSCGQRLCRYTSRHAQISLRVRIPLIGRQTIPAHRLALILSNAFAVLVGITQISLRLRIPLLGRQAIPAHRLALILSNAFGRFKSYTNAQITIASDATPCSAASDTSAPPRADPGQRLRPLS